MEEYFRFTQGLFNPSEAKNKPQPLKGIRVLDFTHFIYGPTCTGILARYGADVIKIEEPGTGDMLRLGAWWGKYWKHTNPLSHSLHHNKYFVTINLKKPEGKELVYKLAEKADVAVENLAAGTAEAWGVGYTQLREVKPDIIYLSCSTYGQYGPLRFFPGWDLLAQAAAGTITITGYPGTDKYYKLPDYLGDFYPGTLGALVVLFALYYRKKTGKGQYIDLAQVETLTRLLPHFTYFSITGQELERTGNIDPAMVPAVIHKTRDGQFVAVAAGTDEQFKALCKAMGREDLATKYPAAIERLKPENAQELNRTTQEWISQKDASEIVNLAKQHGFPAAKVVDDYEITHEEWRRERGSVEPFYDEMYREYLLPGPLAFLSKSPAKVKWLCRPVGYHNRYILKGWLGLSDKELQELEKKKVIGYWDDRPGAKPPLYYDISTDLTFNYQGNGGGTS